MENMENIEDIKNNIITVLMRLHKEAAEFKKNNNLIEYNKRSNAIKNLLLKIESDFDIKFMLKIFILTCEKLNETLNPLDGVIVQKLLKNGFGIKKINSVLEY